MWNPELSEFPGGHGLNFRVAAWGLQVGAGPRVACI